MVRLIAVLLAVSSAMHEVHGIMNTTSVITPPGGVPIYPCLQVDHREQDIDAAMMGLWYVIEIIQHKGDPRSKGTAVSDICPKLTLYKMSPDHIKLIWHERAGEVHYTFRQTDPENKGFWITWSVQNGSMVNRAYKQFSGSVQVIEAQPNQMVLMFCSSAINHTHYSIVMVRNITVHHDTQKIHKTLEHYNLQEYGVRLTCRDPSDPNSGPLQSASAVAIVFPAILLLVSRLNQP